MSSGWYVCDGKERRGPFSFDALIATLQSFPQPLRMPVWRDGYDHWKEAGSVSEFRGVLVPASQSPPLPPAAGGDPTGRAGGVGPPLASAETTPESTDASDHHNVIARGWRGEYPLWLTFWVLGLGALGLAVAIAIATKELLRWGYGTTTGSALLSTAVTWLALPAATIWQVTAVWRAATRRSSENNRLSKHAIWSGLAKVAVVLWAMFVAFGGFCVGVPTIRELIGIAFLGDPDIPPFSIHVMRDGTEVGISGGFKNGLAKEFSLVLHDNPQIRVVHLDSLGGRIGEADRLNAIIRERGLITSTSSECISACTIAFAAGRERWMHRYAILGFHGAAFAGRDDPDAEDLERPYASAGFAPDFIARAVTTPHHRIWTPTPQELLRANVITAILDDTDFAASEQEGK